MRLSLPPTPDHREPDNELYDRGCDLVEAAAAIRRVAGEPEGVWAVPAVLGCIEAALHDLFCAVIAFEATTAEHSLDCGESRLDRMDRGYANLEQLERFEDLQAAPRRAARIVAAPGGDLRAPARPGRAARQPALAA